MDINVRWYYRCCHLKISSVHHVVIRDPSKLEITMLGWPHAAQRCHEFSKIIQHFPKLKWRTQRNLEMIAQGNCFALGNGSSVETV